MQVQPIGIFGEIYIGGDGVAQGYQGKEELTKERFIIHASTGKRLFRTGDFGRWLTNGTLEFAGRKDKQIKIRGYRIELGEIEVTAMKLAGVESARALADNTDGETKLYVFYAGNAQPGAVMEHIRSSLPTYMCPHACRQWALFPLTANGKIDDTLLLQDAKNETEAEIDPDTLTGTELRIAQVWESLLAKKINKANCNFFDAGGHSLKAMQMTGVLEKEFGKKIGLKDIFNNPTVKSLASFMQEQSNDSLLLNLNQAPLANRCLYLIPPIVGSSTIYRSLARDLSGTFRCIGLQYPGFDTEIPFGKSVEHLAEIFCGEMKDYRNKQVYLLGYSFGALVAFEMAKRLEREERNVHLILLDRNIVHNARVEVNVIDKTGWSQIIGRELSNWFHNSATDITERAKALVSQNLENLHAYRQEGMIAGNILTIETGIDNLKMRQWRRYTTGEVNSHKLPGNHYTLLSDPDLPDLIARFAGSIQTSIV
jgi:thioesterase domain-containing protein/acyl carrier protein